MLKKDVIYSKNIYQTFTIKFDHISSSENRRYTNYILRQMYVCIVLFSKSLFIQSRHNTKLMSTIKTIVIVLRFFLTADKMTKYLKYVNIWNSNASCNLNVYNDYIILWPFYKRSTWYCVFNWMKNCPN